MFGSQLLKDACAVSISSGLGALILRNKIRNISEGFAAEGIKKAGDFSADGIVKAGSLAAKGIKKTGDFGAEVAVPAAKKLISAVTGG